MTVDDDLRHTFLTRALTDDQRAALRAAGEERRFEAGEPLFREGRPAEHLWILLEGEIELTRRMADRDEVVATMTTPGQWAGGLAAWAEHGTGSVYRGSGRALTDGRCFLVPSTELARLLAEWSPFATHLIVGVYQTIRSIDATARQRDALVALGTLAAGLAHEINNPASAALRAIESLRSTSGYMLASLVSLAEHGVPADRFVVLDRLRVELMSRDATVESAVAVADREELVGTWMDQHGIELAWVIAPVLATRGVDRAWLAQLEELVGFDALPAALRWISSTVGAAVLLAELSEATQRIAHLVEDVKTYSQLDRAPMQLTDLRTGIESTLAMFGPRLHPVDVVRDFDASVPPIEVHAAELNQVWTNLIDNALDAMEDGGTLTVRTRLDGDHVVVDVVDTGGGVAADVQDHVFEPFFTTKDVGRGTGLGLDICRRIVADRHGGEISLTSASGATTARVRLPLGAAVPAAAPAP